MRFDTRSVELSKHAVARMRTRGISAEEIETIVRAGAREPQGIDAWLSFGSYGGRQLRVACVVENDVIVVKTVF